MAGRKTPCIECDATETAMAYIDTPWCSDRCHKATAAKTGRTQKDLTPELWAEGMARLARDVQGQPHVPFDGALARMLKEKIYAIAAETGLHPHEVARRLGEAAERAAETERLAADLEGDS